MPNPSQKVKCKAHNARTGEPCKNWAILGGTVCVNHGGRTGHVKRKAAERVAEAKARSEAAKYIANSEALDDPLGELLKVAGELVTWKQWLGDRVGQLRADEWRYESSQHLEQLRSEVSLYVQAMTNTAKVLESIGKLEIESRLLRIHEAQAAIVIAMLNNVLGDLDLTPAQQALAGTVVPARLRELDGPQPVESSAGRSQPAALPRSR